MRRILPPLLAVLLASALAGCGGGEEPTQAQTDTAASVTTPGAPAGPQRLILLDPGHNGANAQHTKEINKKVPDGRGTTKPCNTVGTSTNPGQDMITEHEFNFYVAQGVKTILEQNGVKVVMTRDNDTGWGPCVDVRGKQAGAIHADAEISIHADGAPAAAHGFHVIYPKPALNSAQGAPSMSLATYLRDGLSDQMLPTSTYIGKKGLIGRSDLAGLNWSTRPTAMIECGNMKNTQDATNMISDAGEARYSNGIATAILRWLRDNPPAALAAATSSSSRTKIHSTETAKPDTDSDSSSRSGSSSRSSSSGSSTGTTTRKHSSTTSSSTKPSTTKSTTKSTTSTPE
ncbi:MAG TPA: N-acetylmuramoyl-L-alanine amidase [Pseudonocardia sp.]|nr:N-acetylmuramoyl-L-alanine amidase [Pseudonocardia sp.]